MSQLSLTQNVQGYFLPILRNMHDINSIYETEMYGIMSMISKMGTANGTHFMECYDIYAGYRVMI